MKTQKKHSIEIIYRKGQTAPYLLIDEMPFSYKMKLKIKSCYFILILNNFISEFQKNVLLNTRQGLLEVFRYDSNFYIKFQNYFFCSYCRLNEFLRELFKRIDFKIIRYSKKRKGAHKTCKQVLYSKLWVVLKCFEDHERITGYKREVDVQFGAQSYYQQQSYNFI